MDPAMTRSRGGLGSCYRGTAVSWGDSSGVSCPVVSVDEDGGRTARPSRRGASFTVEVKIPQHSRSDRVQRSTEGSTEAVRAKSGLHSVETGRRWRAKQVGRQMPLERAAAVPSCFVARLAAVLHRGLPVCSCLHGTWTDISSACAIPAQAPRRRREQRERR